MKEGKRVWNWLLFFVCAVVLTVGLTAQAACARSVFAPPAVSCAGEAETEKTLIPVGRTVGIKLFSKGVMVVALSEIKTKEGGVWPAKQCGLQEGDIITEIENQPVNSIDEVAKAVRKNGGRAMSIQALRDGRQMAVTAEAAPCMADGTYKLGAWLRDSMAGIGTVTYYDPDNQVFAALGHGINDIDTGLLVPIRSGGILSSSVSAVIKGQKSQPGQLHGTFDLTHDIGTLYANSDCGVLGRAQPEIFPGQPVPVAKRSAVRTGAAVIRCNVDGEQVESVFCGNFADLSGVGRPHSEPAPSGQRQTTAGTDRRHRPGHERLPHPPGRQAGGCGDPCAAQRPHTGVRHLRGKYAGCGVIRERRGIAPAFFIGYNQGKRAVIFMAKKNISVYLSFLLRHRPETIHLSMDKHGWVLVEDLIEGVNKGGRYQLDLGKLEAIVAQDSKGRYRFNADHSKIKACQGHSIPWVEPELEYLTPPDFLYHGTTTAAVEKIRKSGAISKMSRHAVHLQADPEKAWQSAVRWHLTPVVLKIDAQKMGDAGFVFGKAENDVWCTESVPVEYIVEVLSQ